MGDASETQRMRQEIAAEISRAVDNARRDAHRDAVSIAGAARTARDFRDLVYVAGAAVLTIFGAGMLWQEVQARPTLTEVQTIVDNAVDRSSANLERLIKAECK